MSNLVFRDLTANEIEVRIGQIKSNGLSLLLYKDARCDMNILDETVGAINWQREHYECKGNLFCRVGIYFPIPDFENIIRQNICGDGYDAEGRVQNIVKAARNGQWVWKSDCGTESNTEKEKGEASDSFKRACFNWGIGRELYTSPFIWLQAGKELYKLTDNKKCYDKFIVEKIAIEDKKIIGLSIINETLKKRVFVWKQ